MMRIGTLLFEDVELLDFAGPIEVFSVARHFATDVDLDVITIAQQSSIRSVSGVSVNSDVSLVSHPPIDVLLVPGGVGTRSQLHNGVLVNWIRETAMSCQCVLSVCTGALLLAAAGLLVDREATTHHVAYDLLSELSPTTIVHRDRRFVDSGNIVTSAGIAAGIDMSLYMVSRWFGHDVAARTARQMEYPYGEYDFA